MSPSTKDPQQAYGPVKGLLAFGLCTNGSARCPRALGAVPSTHDALHGVVSADVEQQFCEEISSLVLTQPAGVAGRLQCKRGQTQARHRGEDAMCQGPRSRCGVPFKLEILGDTSTIHWTPLRRFLPSLEI